MIEYRKVLTTKVPNFKGYSFNRIFNPTAIRLTNGNIMCAFRIFGAHTKTSSLGKILTTFSEGKIRVFSGVCFREYDISGKKVVKDFNELPLLIPNKYQIVKFPNGFYDPRLSKIGSDYLLTVVGVNHDENIIPKEHQHNFQYPLIGFNHTLLFRTKNFMKFRYFGKIGPREYDKNMFFLNEKVSLESRKYYVLFHRYKNSIQVRMIKKLADLKNINAWRRYINNYKDHILISPQYYWEGVRVNYPGQVGGIAPPIPFQYDTNTKSINISKLNSTEHTFYLMFYNTVIGKPGNPVWGRSVGAVILIKDRSNPRVPFKVIARSVKPILKPS